MVIPTLQAGALLEEQLIALSEQTWSGPLEVVVCDNGSTDGSTDRVESHPRTRLLDASARRGAAAARNLGVAHARGDVVLFCDADDLVAPDWVATMVAALAEHPVVVGRAELHRLNSARVRATRSLPEGLQAGGDLPAYAGAGNLGIRREVFLAVGGFDESLAHLEDVDFSWRVQHTGHALYYEPAAVVHVRLRATFATQFRQGRDYGRAWALLERRWRPRVSVSHPPADETVTAAQHPASRWRSALVALERVMRHPVGGVGHATWTLGWHLGHRDASVLGADSAVAGWLTGDSIDFPPVGSPEWR
ncbi:glycosyltransferase family 2 protein [Nocardioides pacificus]